MFVCLLAVLSSLQAPSSPTRDQTPGPQQRKHRVLTPGPPGNSRVWSFYVLILAIILNYITYVSFLIVAPQLCQGCERCASAPRCSLTQFSATEFPHALCHWDSAEFTHLIPASHVHVRGSYSITFCVLFIVFLILFFYL